MRLMRLGETSARPQLDDSAQQGGGVPPDPVPVPVETHRGDRVDGGPAAVLADPLWRRQILQLSECLSLAVCSAADFGGVVGPVGCGGALPGHGDADVDAEHAGEDRGGQVGGELEQRGGAVSGGLESELAESLRECVRADRAPGLPAGEQPWRGTGVADGGFSATVRYDREGKCGNGFGQHDGLVAETDKDPLVTGMDVGDAGG